MKSDLIDVTLAMTKHVRYEIKRTGVTPSRILKVDDKDDQLGLTNEIILDLLSPKIGAQTIRKDHWEQIVTLWSKLPDAIKTPDTIPITPDMIDLLHSEIKRTGVKPRNLIHDNERAQRIGLKSSMMWAVLSKECPALDIRLDHWELALELWADLPDDPSIDSIKVTLHKIHRIKKAMERTGVDAKTLLKGNNKTKEINLTPPVLESLLLSEQSQSIRKDHWKLAMALWGALPHRSKAEKKTEIFWNERLAQDLKARVQATQIHPSKFLQGRHDIPNGLNKDLLLSLLTDFRGLVKADYVSFIESVCVELNEPHKRRKKVFIDQNKRDEILAQIDRTGLTITRLLKISNPTEINANRILRVAKSLQKTYYQKDIDLVLQLFKNLPDKR